MCVCVGTSHHSELSNHTCVPGERASAAHEAPSRMRSAGKKQPDKSSSCLSCKLGSGLPKGGAGIQRVH